MLHMQLTILLPTGSFLQKAVHYVAFYTPDGEVTLYPHHAPTVFQLHPTFVRFQSAAADDNNIERVFVPEGVATIREDGMLMVYAPQAYQPSSELTAYLDESIALYQEKLDHGEEGPGKMLLVDKLEAFRRVRKLSMET